MSPITNHKFIPECCVGTTPWFTRFANGHSNALLLRMGYDIILLQEDVNALTLIREKTSPCTFVKGICNHFNYRKI